MLWRHDGIFYRIHIFTFRMWISSAAMHQTKLLWEMLAESDLILQRASFAGTPSPWYYFVISAHTRILNNYLGRYGFKR